MLSKLTPYEAFAAAVDSAGGQVAFARICGCTAANIGQMLRRKSLLPARYVIPVERANLGFSRHHLRPDIYPAEIVKRDASHARSKARSAGS